MSGRWRRGLAPLALAAATTLGCLDITDPSGISAIDFVGIPFPAVVTGDTLRDAAGVATPLSARVYDGSGNEIADPPVSFVSLDTGVAIDAQGFVTATRRSGTVRLVASVPGLQSQLRSLRITREPSDLVRGDSAVTLAYAIPDAPGNVSPPLTLTLRTADILAGESAGVQGWLVRWRIVYAGDTLSPTDTNRVALWPASGSRHSLQDTTATDGGSTRRLRVYANVLPVQQDSFVVVAEVFNRGAHVPGSPVRYVVTITPPGL